jgi:hypothetical protein
MFRNRTETPTSTGTTSRRSFLRRVGGGLAAGVAARLGLAQSVSAYDYQCCTLCLHPGSCNCPSGRGWCWRCCDDSSGGLGYTCCECFRQGYTPRGDTCVGVWCSWAYRQLPNCLSPAP